MSDVASPPPIDRDVDLTDFPFMPIMIAQLQRSKAWLICKKKPQLAFYMLNLWMAAWHGRPAASIENDDMVLADVAGCDEKVWAKVKSDVLRGWIVCNDGRIYHPVVAERAKEAWSRKVARRSQTEAARQAREAERARKAELRKAEDRKSAALIDSAVTDNVTETDINNATSSKREREGEREGQGEGYNTPSLRSGSGGGSICDRFFEVYPKHEAEDGVRRELDRLVGHGVPESDVIDGAKRYAATVAGKPPDKIANPVTWLRDGRWKDGTRAPPPKPLVDVGVRVDRDTPAGRDWAAYELARTGHPVKWILPSGPNGPGRHFPTEWPPTSQEDAA